MRTIKSFIRRNSRLTQTQRETLSHDDSYLLETIAPSFWKDKPYIGLEIGFGMGDSILDVALKNPDQFWLGVEVYEIGVASVIGRARSDNLTNMALHIGDVSEFIDVHIPHQVIDHVRIFFPDPWPKKRHQKRRLVQADFLSQISSKLKSGAVIHIATDDAHYAEHCLSVLEKHPNYEISSRKMYRPLTKFAKKAIAKNIPITDIVAIHTSDRTEV